MIRLGSTTVIVSDDGWTQTFMADAPPLHADHAEQPGQGATARELGLTPFEMNAAHDLTHSLLAHWLGLPHSPTLHAVANGAAAVEEVWRREEAAVLALQAYAKVVGVDLVEIARRMG